MPKIIIEADVEFLSWLELLDGVRAKRIKVWKGKQLTGRVGCYYPPGEKGDFISSNLGETVCVEAEDGGYFYAEVDG